MSALRGSARGTRGNRPQRDKKEKFYPLENHPEKYFPIDKNFTNFNNVQYYGDSIGKYDKRLTNLSDENIIINLSQFNPTSNTFNIPMAYIETRDAPILPYKADSYALCVASCYIPSTSIYLFEWIDTVTPQSGINYDKYTITIEVNNVAGMADGVTTRALEFVPYVRSDATNGIKRVFEINQCVVSLNNAFKDMWNIDLNILPADYNTVCYPPTFQLDVESSLIYILLDERVNPASYPAPGTPNPSFNNSDVNTYDLASSWIKISFNYWVHQWFQSSFPCSIVSTNPIDLIACTLNIFNDFSNERFINYPYGVANGNIPSAYDPEISDGVNQLIFYQLYQFNSTTELFSTVQKVIITSSIQVRPNYTRITAEGSANNITPSSMQYIGTLLDFSHTVSSFNNGESASPIEYTPVLHVWQDLLTQDQINQLSYAIHVQRTDGTLTSLQLLPGEMCNIKLMFRLK
jgi:hypothetical protein